MDFALNEEQLELQEMVRDFVEKENYPLTLPKWTEIINLCPGCLKKLLIWGF